MIAVFDGIGMGQWFRYLTGAVLTHLFLIGGRATPALTFNRRRLPVGPRPLLPLLS